MHFGFVILSGAAWGPTKWGKRSEGSASFCITAFNQTHRKTEGTQTYLAMNTHPPNRPRPSEEGYILVAVIFMMAILILSLSIAVPRVKAAIQRDREIETMQRGKQYIRAVQLYYKKFNTYPPNVDALVKTNNIRFLRKKYIDPTTGKDEWKPILFGQNKTPQAMGFFGQPLAAANGAGIGPSGGNTGLNGAAGSPGTNGLFNSTPTGSTDTGASGAPTGGTDANGNPVAPTSAAGPTAGPTGTTTTSAFGSTNNPTGTGQTFGGGGIIGFSPQSPKQSILVYKKKNHYNEWEFLYSPQMDQQTMAGGNTGAIGQPASSTTTPVGGTTPTTPAPTPTTPTTPQQ
ncbi:type II secretion system protein [Telmatobacter sp. DSM 110680]|uniref:Type II secretion system protein n=1 Tax=Telmatobacter sp. DSM 110680 TaxID=3036704 RepID=A0AAU7DF19_9BACT